MKENYSEIVGGVSTKENVALVNVHGIGFVDASDAIADAFNAIKEEDINVLMITKGSCEPTISIVIEEKHLSKAVNAIRDKFGNGNIQKINKERDIAILTVLNIKGPGKPGIAGRIFRKMGENNINIKMISQDPSEFDISFVVNKKNIEKSMEVLRKLE
ncbi:MAG: Aspartokinase LysC [Candidatus Methanohalarchaeum thermophilum]|uniref:aspartate kinase n=1 Tax=Methanohalarchaeum thermophilum TaxID=1903181 RepID=A0A1Q6DW28_METT1|nr:MAG: Aspartokinase LysC [Candidatus Methanohalarchaeum thermophilum]